jgi:hypothetical protein
MAEGRRTIPGEYSDQALYGRIEKPSIDAARKTSYAVWAGVGGDEDRCRLVLQVLFGKMSVQSRGASGWSRKHAGPGVKPVVPAGPGPNSAVVRRWARAQGYEVPVHGSVKAEIFRRFRIAMGGETGV